MGLKNVKDLIELLEVFLVPEGLEEQGQVISIPLRHGLEVLLGGPGGDGLGGKELEEEDLDRQDEEIPGDRVPLPAAPLQVDGVTKTAVHEGPGLEASQECVDPVDELLVKVELSECILDEGMGNR